MRMMGMTATSGTWRMVVRAARGEVESLATVARGMLATAFSTPTGTEDPHPAPGVPVVLAHGIFGDPSNFSTLRDHLARQGFTRFASFSYLPQLDVARLAARLAERIDACCEATGTPHVDVVGHSLGGLVARHLLASGRGRRIRHLVTLGSPRFIPTRLPRELAIYGAFDPLVPPPAKPEQRSGRSLTLPDCGHLGLLTHPDALRAVAAWLTRPAATLRAVPRAA